MTGCPRATPAHHRPARSAPTFDIHSGGIALRRSLGHAGTEGAAVEPGRPSPGRRAQAFPWPLFTSTTAPSTSGSFTTPAKSSVDASRKISPQSRTLSRGLSALQRHHPPRPLRVPAGILPRLLARMETGRRDREKTRPGRFRHQTAQGLCRKPAHPAANRSAVSTPFHEWRRP